MRVARSLSSFSAMLPAALAASRCEGSSSLQRATDLFTSASESMTESNIVCEWLRHLGLEQYFEKFVDNGYDDLEMCKQIGEPDLDAIGVFDQTHRNIVHKAVKTLLEQGGTSVYISIEEFSKLAESEYKSLSASSGSKTKEKKQKTSASSRHSDTKFANLHAKQLDLTDMEKAIVNILDSKGLSLLEGNCATQELSAAEMEVLVTEVERKLPEDELVPRDAIAETIQRLIRRTITNAKSSSLPQDCPTEPWTSNCRDWQASQHRSTSSLLSFSRLLSVNSRSMEKDLNKNEKKDGGDYQKELKKKAKLGKLFRSFSSNQTSPKHSSKTESSKQNSEDERVCQHLLRLVRPLEHDCCCPLYLLPAVNKKNAADVHREDEHEIYQRTGSVSEKGIYGRSTGVSDWQKTKKSTDTEKKNKGKIIKEIGRAMSWSSREIKEKEGKNYTPLPCCDSVQDNGERQSVLSSEDSPPMVAYNTAKRPTSFVRSTNQTYGCLMVKRQNGSSGPCRGDCGNIMCSLSPVRFEDSIQEYGTKETQDKELFSEGDIQFDEEYSPRRRTKSDGCGTYRKSAYDIGASSSDMSCHPHLPPLVSSAISPNTEKCSTGFCVAVGRARALVDYTPSPYDKDSLAFKKGDIIEILVKSNSGYWIGKLDNKIGHVKFINVEEISPLEDNCRLPLTLPEDESKNAPTTLEDFLEQLGLENYLNVLVLHGFHNLDSLRELTRENLLQLGILEADRQEILLRAVEQLKDVSYEPPIPAFSIRNSALEKEHYGSDHRQPDDSSPKEEDGKLTSPTHAADDSQEIQKTAASNLDPNIPLRPSTLADKSLLHHRFENHSSYKLPVNNLDLNLREKCRLDAKVTEDVTGFTDRVSTTDTIAANEQNHCAMNIPLRHSNGANTYFLTNDRVFDANTNRPLSPSATIDWWNYRQPGINAQVNDRLQQPHWREFRQTVDDSAYPLPDYHSQESDPYSEIRASGASDRERGDTRVIVKDSMAGRKYESFFLDQEAAYGRMYSHCDLPGYEVNKIGNGVDSELQSEWKKKSVLRKCSISRVLPKSPISPVSCNSEPTDNMDIATLPRAKKNIVDDTKLSTCDALYSRTERKSKKYRRKKQRSSPSLLCSPSAPTLQDLVARKLQEELIDLRMEPYTDKTGFCGIPPALVQRYAEELQQNIFDVAEALDQERVRLLQARGRPAVPNDFLADSCCEPVISANYDSLPDWLISIGLPIYEKCLRKAGFKELYDVASMTDSDMRQCGIQNERHIRLFKTAIEALHIQFDHHGYIT